MQSLSWNVHQTEAICRIHSESYEGVASLDTRIEIAVAYVVRDRKINQMLQPCSSLYSVVMIFIQTYLKNFNLAVFNEGTLTSSVVMLFSAAVVLALSEIKFEVEN